MNPHPDLRIGEGWDVHQLVTGRPLVLGGVTIPHSHGLLGHSATPTRCCTPSPTRCWAAPALGDIGRHFPDTDPAFAAPIRRAAGRGRAPRARRRLEPSATSTAPSSPRRPRWRRTSRRCAAHRRRCWGWRLDAVNVKAKTAEKMGPVGEGRAIEARAVCLLGAMSANPDGDFGGKTQDGVKRLQWYLGAMAWRLRVPPDSDPLHGTLETYTQPAGVQVDGFVRPATMAELLTLWQGGYELTSPLVAMSITGLSNVETAGTFTVLTYPSAAAGEVLVHQDFVASLRVMNTKAADAKVTLRINQAFRVQGVAVNGAVVPPASSSQHLIGNSRLPAHALQRLLDDGQAQAGAGGGGAGGVTAEEGRGQLAQLLGGHAGAVVAHGQITQGPLRTWPHLTSATPV
jgi:2-C-methyl-D-erythritol 2,4-cyclodiphosphate synthase